MVVALAAIDAGYMALDGTIALTRGDYITPKTGDYAGQLGPWARVVRAVGLDPRSTAMKAFFVAYGLAWLGVTVGFVLQQPWAWAAMLGLGIGSLWYMIPGTFVSVAIIAMLFVPAVRDLYR